MCQVLDIHGNERTGRLAERA